MIVLYDFPLSPPCRAVKMVAKHLGIDLTLKEVNILEGEQFKPEFLKMNPQHSIPTIDDDGFYLWESRAILAYLINKYSPGHDLYPQDPKRRAVIDRLLYFDAGTLYHAAFALMIPQIKANEPEDPEKLKTFKSALDTFEGILEKSSYVAGDHLSIADLSILAGLSLVELADFDFSLYPNVQAWQNKLKKELPYYEEINGKPISEFKEMKKQKG